MSKKDLIPFYFRCLKKTKAPLLSALLGVASAHALANPPSAPAVFEPHPALPQEQALVDQAFGNYFKALMSGSKEQAHAAESALNQAQGKVTQILQDQRERGFKSVFEKVYFADGRIIDSAEYDSHPETYDQESIENAGAKAQSQDSNDQTQAATPSSREPSPPITRPETALDGSKAPKELVFPGKKSKPTSKSPRP